MVKRKKEEVMKAKKVRFSNYSCEFFKIYFSKFSSKKLAIPRAAVRGFDRITKRKDVVLKDHAGGKWNCKIEKANRGIAITDGWQKFALQHSLKDGDFLTFNYNGDSLFDVEVYATNGILKEDNTEIDTETESEFEEEEEEAEQNSEKSEGSGLTQTALAKPRRSAEKILEKHKACASSSAATLQNPHFWADITPSSEHALHVSHKVAKLHGIELKQILMLCDEEGNKWPVKVAFRQDGRIAFTKGWAHFFRRNNLKHFDRCLFEFMVDSNNISGEAKVQILRSNLPT